MKKNVLIIIIMIMFFCCCRTQINYYRGYIYDFGRQPIVGVKVYSPYDTIGTFGITDSNGFFQIKKPKHIISNFLYIKNLHTIIDSIRIVGSHGGEQLHYSFVDGKNDTLFIDRSKIENENNL